MPSKPAQIRPESAIIMQRSRCVFIAQWEELLRLRRVVIKTANQDDIHDLRVASRRFRAVLELFYPLLPKGSKTELRKTGRKLTGTLGGLRNIDEALLFFKSRDSGAIPSGSKLCRALSALRIRELKRIKKLLKTFDHRNLDRGVRKIAAIFSPDTITVRDGITIQDYFSEAYSRHHLPIQPLLACSTAPEHRATRHALRIAIKKWRYFLEIIAPILERDYAPLLELLKQYQSLLGRMNDMAEFKILLSNLKLPPTERQNAEATLLTEEMNLLESFTKLIDQKPLADTLSPL